MNETSGQEKGTENRSLFRVGKGRFPDVSVGCGGVVSAAIAIALRLCEGLRGRTSGCVSADARVFGHTGSMTGISYSYLVCRVVSDYICLVRTNGTVAGNAGRFPVFRVPRSIGPVGRRRSYGMIYHPSVRIHESVGMTGGGIGVVGEYGLRR